jgi:Protein of unknown function (DUF3467)
LSFDEDHPLEVDFEVPNRLRVGVYANAARISYTLSEFTLDLAVFDPELDESGRAIVCARVRIPVIFVFDVLRAINLAMTSYEQDYGEIRRPDQ